MKRQVFLLVLVGAMILLSACQQAEKKWNPGEALSVADIDKCKQNTDLHNVERCYETIALKFSDASVCEMIEQDEASRNYCLSEIGQEKYDENICRKITFPDQRSTCLRYVALYKDDMSLCTELVPATKTLCLNEISNNTKTIEPCFLIEDEDDQVNCYSKRILHKDTLVLPQSYEVCSNAAESLRDQCYYDMAQLFGDADICLKIKDGDRRTRCNNTESY